MRWCMHTFDLKVLLYVSIFVLQNLMHTSIFVPSNTAALMYIFWLFIEKCRILSRVVERRCLSGLRLLAHLALIWNHIRSRSSFPQKKGSRSTTSTSEAATKGSKPHSSVSYSAKKRAKILTSRKKTWRILQAPDWDWFLEKCAW